MRSAESPSKFIAANSWRSSGPSGSGKAHHHEHPWVPGPLSSGRYLLEGIDVSKHDKKALALIRNEKIGPEGNNSVWP